MYLSKKSLNRTNKSQTGAGLVELLIGIAIIGIIAYLAVTRGTTAREGNTSNSAVSDMQIFINGVQKARPDKNYAGLAASEVCMHMPRNNCNQATNALSHSAGGAVTVGDSTIGGLSHATITFALYPATACGAASGAVADGVSEISIGGTPVKNATTAFSQQAANGACGSTPSTVVLAVR